MSWVAERLEAGIVLFEEEIMEEKTWTGRKRGYHDRERGKTGDRRTRQRSLERRGRKGQRRMDRER